MGFGCSIDEIAANSLTYDISVGVREKKIHQARIESSSNDPPPNQQQLHHSNNVKHIQTQTPLNIYSVGYSNLTEGGYSRDGVNVLEPVVYAPPIIPGIMKHSEAIMHQKGGQLFNNNRDEFNLLPHQRGPFEMMPKSGVEVARGHLQQQHVLVGQMTKEKGATKVNNFGMLGDGMLLSAKDAALIASHTVQETAPYRHCGDNKDMMLLYVNKDAAKGVGGKKRRRQGNNSSSYGEGGEGEYYETAEEQEARGRAEARQMLVSKQFKIVSDVALQHSLRSTAGPGVPVLFSRSKNPRVPQMLTERGGLGVGGGGGEVERQVKIAENQNRALRRSSNPPGPNLYERAK